MAEIPSSILGEWGDAWQTDRDRIEALEAAIRQHRFDIGRGYHYHSFRTVHAANKTLWELVADRSIFHTEETTTQSDQLHRPAMMEDDRE